MQATHRALHRQRWPAAATAAGAAATGAARRPVVMRMTLMDRTPPRCGHAPSSSSSSSPQARILRRGRCANKPPVVVTASAADGADAPTAAAAKEEPPATAPSTATETTPSVVPRPSPLARPWRFPEQALGGGSLTDAQRAQRAADWGYEALGQVLPEELAVRAVAEAALFSPLPPTGTQRQIQGEEKAEEGTSASAATLTSTDIDPAATDAATDPRTPAPVATALRSLLSLAVIAAGYAWMWHMRLLLPAWQAALCWLAIGTAYFGLFQGVGGDAARGALLPQRPRLRDALGALVMAPALWSFTSWRARWWAFVRHPNFLVDSADEWRAAPGARRAAASPFAVRPLTLRRLGGFLPLHRRLHRLVRATPLRFFGPSLAAWFRSWDALDLRRWNAEERLDALRSWMAPMAFVALAWPPLARFGAAVAGCDSQVGGWCLAWLGPWMVFHMWTSVLALAQRTGPHAVWARRPRSAHQAALGGYWDYGRALLGACATLSLPRWLEVLIHDANYHLPAAVASACCIMGTPGVAAEGGGGVCAVPSPRLRAAHVRLRRRLGPYLTEGRLLSPRLLSNLMTGWLVFDEHGSGTYMDWDDALAALREERRQQRAAAEAAAAAAAGGAEAASATPA